MGSIIINANHQGTKTSTATLLLSSTLKSPKSLSMPMACYWVSHQSLKSPKSLSMPMACCWVSHQSLDLPPQDAVINTVQYSPCHKSALFSKFDSEQHAAFTLHIKATMSVNIVARTYRLTTKMSLSLRVK